MCGLGMPGGGVSSGDRNNPCEWQFGETLTLPAHLPDVMGPGLRLRLVAHGEVRLGPLQMDLVQVQELGECMVSLRRRVLPACSAALDRGLSSPGPWAWSSPVVLPLADVGQGRPSEGGYCFGEVSAYVALCFGVSMDPEVLRRLADNAERPLAERLAAGLPLPRQLTGGPAEWAASGCSGCSRGRAGKSSTTAAAASRPARRSPTPSEADDAGFSAEAPATSAWSYLTDMGAELDGGGTLDGPESSPWETVRPRGVGPRELPSAGDRRGLGDGAWDTRIDVL